MSRVRILTWVLDHTANVLSDSSPALARFYSRSDLPAHKNVLRRRPRDDAHGDNQIKMSYMTGLCPKSKSERNPQKSSVVRLFGTRMIVRVRKDVIARGVMVILENARLIYLVERSCIVEAAFPNLVDGALRSSFVRTRWVRLDR